MKARDWTTWERYLPSAKSQTRTGAAALCLKLGDLALPEEGIEERMSCREPAWRLGERKPEADLMAQFRAEERIEKVHV
jgi:hypothetical protein